MNQYKFRAWIYKEKTMVSIERLYIPLNSKSVIIGASNETKTIGINHIGYDKDIEIMQWIGLYDKFGKEIYTGDIVRNHNGDIGEVKWIIEHCAYVIRTLNPHKYHYIQSDGILANVEVIGNIYEHSYLLEEINAK